MDLKDSFHPAPSEPGIILSETLLPVHGHIYEKTGQSVPECSGSKSVYSGAIISSSVKRRDCFSPSEPGIIISKSVYSHTVCCTAKWTHLDTKTLPRAYPEAEPVVSAASGPPRGFATHTSWSSLLGTQPS